MQRVFSGTVGGFEKSPSFVVEVALKKNWLFTAYVQNDAPLSSRMHAVVFSIDQRPC